MKAIINWLIFLTIVMVILILVSAWNHTKQYLPSLPERGAMTGLQVIIFAISFAFMWVEVLKWWKQIKPFNCIKCMTGWTAVILALAFHVEFWYMYLPVGLCAGAIFEGIKMRWL